MCLGLSGKIIKIKKDRAIVDFSGSEQSVVLALLDKVSIGDWVLVHAGFAIARINQIEAKKNQKLIKEVLDEK